MKCTSALSLLIAVICALAGNIASASGPRTLTWQDLQPAGEAERNGEIVDQMHEMAYEAIRNRRLDQYQADVAGLKSQIRFGVVRALEGQHVRVPGYMVPLEFSPRGDVLEFLLVPFYGACLHVPAPPPNQIVHVVAKRPQPAGDLETPVWAEGILTIEGSETQLASVSYRLDLTRLRPHDGTRIQYGGAIPHSDGD